MPPRPEIESVTLASGQLRAINGEPNVSRLYLGSQLQTFLRDTAGLGSHDMVQARHYIPGESGRPGVHVRLKNEILFSRPDGVATRFPDRASRPRVICLDLELDSRKLVGPPLDLNDVLQILDTADSLASAVPGTEYTAIQVINPPEEIAHWFEKQTTNQDSGWKKPLDGVPEAQLDEYVGVSQPRIPTFIKWL